MARVLGYLVLLLAFTSLVYARSNICLANTGSGQPYKPLQLYFSLNCPMNTSNCTAAVYDYSYSAWMSQGPAQLIPSASIGQVYLYFTQTDDDTLQTVVIYRTNVNLNVINSTVTVTGAQFGAQIQVHDDPTGDVWNWNPATNSGTFTNNLNTDYTDGYVLGSWNITGDFCLNYTYVTNINNALANLTVLSGNVSVPAHVYGSKYNSSYTYQICQYPQTMVSWQDISCGTPAGSATATSLSGTGATYLWTMGTTTVGTTSTVTGLSVGNYTVAITVGGCTSTRYVTITSSVNPVSSALGAVVNPGKTSTGQINITTSGGTPPYTIIWMNSEGSVVATNVTSFIVPAGTTDTYTITVTDGCTTATDTASVSAPGACSPGTMVNAANCSYCPAGTFSSTFNSATCTVCPPGTWNNVIGATSCNQCPANTVSGGATGPCTSCTVSYYSAAGSGVCTACPVGSDRASNASSCNPCAAGSFRCADGTTCAPCAPGTYSSGGMQSCAYCAPGTYSLAGASSCTTCPINTYAFSNSSSCSACPTGTTSAQGSSVQLACMSAIA